MEYIYIYIWNIYIYIYMEYIYRIFHLYVHIFIFRCYRDYLCKISFEVNVASDESNTPNET